MSSASESPNAQAGQKRRASEEPVKPPGAACLSCRTRKVKCSGERPSCRECVAKRARRGLGEEDLPCEYEDIAQGAKRPRVSAKKLQTLEEKVQELEATLRKLDAAPPAPAAAASWTPPAQNAVASTSYAPPAVSFTTGNDAVVPFATLSELPSLSNGSSPTELDSLLAAIDTDMLPKELPMDLFSDPSKIGGAHTRCHKDSGPPLVNSAQYQKQFIVDPVTSLLDPAWPCSLPPAFVVIKLTTLLFMSNHPARSFLNARLLNHVTLPSTHPDFPPESLLHCICGTVVTIKGEGFLVDMLKEYGIRPYWGADGAMEYHHERSMEALDRDLNTPSRYFSCIQAILFNVYFCVAKCRFIRSWIELSRAARLATLLGLDSMPSTLDAPAHKWGAMGPPKNDEEFIERSYTMWWLYSYNVYASSNTGWPMVSGGLISTPVPYQPSKLQGKKAECYNPTHPTFVTNHPRAEPALMNMQIHFKGLYIFGQIVRFVQRAPAPYGCGHYVKLDYDLTEGASFKALKEQIDAYQLAIPGECYAIRFPPTIESSYAALAINHSHTSRIFLYEQFIKDHPDDAHLEICIRSAYTIFRDVRDRTSSPVVKEMLPMLFMAWSTCARALVRKVAILELHKVDPEGTEQLKKDVGKIVFILRSYDLPHAHNYANVLQAVLSKPALALRGSDLFRPTPMATGNLNNLTQETQYWPAQNNTSSTLPPGYEGMLASAVAVSLMNNGKQEAPMTDAQRKERIETLKTAVEAEEASRVDTMMAMARARGFWDGNTAAVGPPPIIVQDGKGFS